MWISFSDHYKIGQNFGAIFKYPRVVSTLPIIKIKHKHFPYFNAIIPLPALKIVILTITITIICM